MENYGCFPSIHPPSIIEFSSDDRPPSPLASAPNTPQRSVPVSDDEADDVVPATRRTTQLSETAKDFLRLNCTGKNPFDDEPEEYKLSSWPEKNAGSRIFRPRRFLTRTVSAPTDPVDALSPRGKLHPNSSFSKPIASPDKKPKFSQAKPVVSPR